MATAPGTETSTAAATKLKLDPPEALQPVVPAEASGLVPLKTEETTELDKRVEHSSMSLPASIPTAPNSVRRSTS